MMTTELSDLFAKGTLAWATETSKSFLNAWNDTVGWSKETPIPSHLITFSGEDFYTATPTKPYFLDFKGGALTEELLQEDFVPKDAWRDVIKSLLRKENAMGFVLIAETEVEGKSALLLSYEGTGGHKYASLVYFNLEEDTLVYEEPRYMNLDNPLIKISSNLSNIFEENDILN